jgi:radical SAM superfamily enzyme YgiQ (UPF0313 family)
MAMEAEYYRKMGYDVIWDEPCSHPDRIVTSPEGVPFETLPAPDRVFTRAKDKKYQSYGNYKYRPATHMQVADGCWHGVCSFCVEKGRPYVRRTLEDVIKEIKECERLGFKEIFDDSGTFPEGKWVKQFLGCKMVFAPKIIMGCNMRIGADVDFERMKQANFRMVLFGIESANQLTLDRINKGVNANDIIPTIKRAAAAGLEPHIAIMCGFPWEDETEENKTFELVRYLLRGGYAKTAQASVYNVTGEQAKKTDIKKIYSAALYLDFWKNKLSDVRSWADLCYLGRSIKKGLLRD